MSAEQYWQTAWAFVQEWFARGLQFSREAWAALLERVPADLMTENLIAPAAAVFLALLVLMLLLRLRSTRRKVRELTKQLDELNSKYDAEIRWRMARERYDTKSKKLAEA